MTTPKRHRILRLLGTGLALALLLVWLVNRELYPALAFAAIFGWATLCDAAFVPLETWSLKKGLEIHRGIARPHWRRTLAAVCVFGGYILFAAAGMIAIAKVMILNRP